MMNVEDIILLLKAGYTKADIDSFNAFPSSPPKAEAPAEAPAELVAAGTSAEEKKKDDPVPAAAPVTDNTAVLAALEKLTNVIQKQNIRSDDLNPVRAKTAEDILASVINPQK